MNVKNKFTVKSENDTEPIPAKFLIPVGTGKANKNGEKEFHHQP
jgi:hypothetical protein